MCGQIASYYRLAVKRNIGDIDSIIQAVNAIPLHLGANDENAEHNHRFCPLSRESWCQFQAAKCNNVSSPHLPNYLSEDAVNFILEVYKDFKLNTPELISKISEGRTFNHNECLHFILFDMVKKTEAVGIDTMKLGAALAIIRYNEAYAGVKKVFETLGIIPGINLEDRFSKWTGIGYIIAATLFETNRRDS